MKIPVLLSCIMLCLLSGCAISKNVQSVDSNTRIQKIYVEENPKVHMDGLLPEIVTQLQALGFETEVYTDNRPVNAQHYITFTANWAWDMAMYLTYFQATLYDNGRVLGEAEYNAKKGGANMNKFGKTAEKIRPLLSEMLQNVERGTPATPMGK